MALRDTANKNNNVNTYNDTILVTALSSYPNATFIKDYKNSQNSVNADYSVGSGVGTFTATRSSTAPATYVTSDGTVVTTITSNIPRFTAGFYDSTGFVSRPGIILERNIANLIPKSSDIDDATWTETDTVAEDADTGSSSPDGTATSPSLTATGANGTLLLTTAVTAQTYSVWLKRKTGTGNIDITANSGTGWTTVTVTSSWTRHQVTAASASQTCGIRVVTSGDAVYVWGNQFEALPFASTYIPTTSVSLTRGNENLKYVIADNRTVATESIFIKATLFYSSTENATNYRLHDTDTKGRRAITETSNDDIQFLPNGTDTVGSFALTSSGLTKFVSFVHAGTCQSTGDPNVVGYLNGTSEGTDNDDFTEPAWGTSFYVGCESPSSAGFAIIESFVVYSDVKSAPDVAAISTIMINT